MGVLEPATTPARYSRRIPRVSPRSPHNARQWAHGLIAGLGLDPDSVELAVSELTTNVVRYAPGPACVALRITAEAIEVVVTDGHAETAAQVRVGNETDDYEATSGRGLFILAMLAADEHIHVEPDGHARKRVRVILPIGDPS
jgi:anti-sigma regulatory factor (Ser/Thr protein kinase)